MVQRTTIVPQSLENSYAKILQRTNIKFKADGTYLQTGSLKGMGGWALDVSIVKPQIVKALSILCPLLIKEKVHFKLAKDLNTCELLLNGSLGYKSTGKILRIYPDTVQHAQDLAKQIVELTREFRGPAIPTDAYLGGCVYTWHGAFDLSDADCLIPFYSPKTQAWPFNELVPRPRSSSRTLNGSYILRDTLKSDAKGRVLKAYKFQGLTIKRCIIKEGLHDMFVDSTGRDFQSRIEWQHRCLIDLAGKIPVPKVFELFRDSGNTYLAMEEVLGTPLNQRISEIHQDQGWRDLTDAQKDLLLEYLSQIIGIIGKLHAEGYIHRDLSPSNFIADSKEKIVMIDLELSYNEHHGLPLPPFQSGINGFTAPERIDSAIPSYAEDVYSLGAVIATFITNIFPARGFATDLDHLRGNLQRLTGDHDLVDLIIRCMNQDPALRPSLAEISDFIGSYRESNRTRTLAPWTGPPFEILISDAVRSLSTPLMTDERQLWKSNELSDDRLVENEQKKQQVYLGMYAGIAGCIYMIASAKSSGYNPGKLVPNWTTNYNHLISLIGKTINDIGAGLYIGADGVALALSRAVATGLISSTADNRRAISKCLAQQTSDPTLGYGLAGKGLALLASMSVLPVTETEPQLRSLTSALLKMANKKGTWSTNGEVYNGLARGTAGVVTFLLAYYQRTQDEAVLPSIEKALDALLAERRKVNGKLVWPVSDKKKIIDPWLVEGITGIAVAFLRGYSYLHKQKYAEVARQTLYQHPAHLASNNLETATGMPGLGHAYLDAAAILGDEDMSLRAQHIGDHVASLSYIQRNGSKYWALEDRRPPTADFMVGNSGIIQFLLRLKSPISVPFPTIDQF